MDFISVIRQRRSCRRFLDKTPPREVLERIVDAGLWAPSGKNRQPWRIFVATGTARDKLAELAHQSFPHLEPSLKTLFPDKVVAMTRNFFRNFGGAPVVVLVYVEPTDEGDFVDLQTGAAAVENILLAAANEGLQGCWMANPVTHFKEEIDAALGVSEAWLLVAMIPIGYPAIEPPVPPRRSGRITWVGFPPDS